VGRVQTEDRVRPGGDAPAPYRLRAVLVGLLVAAASYAGGVLLGMALVAALSSNTHDRSVEGAMTGAFVVGPLLAVLGFVVGALAYARRARRRRDRDIAR
jgi:hypothetical protein